jgi:hypothetical protein
VSSPKSKKDIKIASKKACGKVSGKAKYLGNTNMGWHSVVIISMAYLGII